MTTLALVFFAVLATLVAAISLASGIDNAFYMAPFGRAAFTDVIAPIITCALCLCIAMFCTVGAVS